MIDEEFHDDDLEDEVDHEESEDEGEQEESPETAEVEESDEPEEDEEDQAAKRERRREERRLKKERQKHYQEEQRNKMARLESENQRLAQAVAAVENRGLQSEYQQIKTAMGEAEQRYVEAQAIFKKAREDGDMDRAFEAQDALNKIQNAYGQLKQSETVLLEQAKQKANPSPAGLNPQAISLRTQWLSKHNNFSNVPLADRQDIEQIDALVYSKGYKPDTEAYWNELERRIKVGLPHLFRETTRNTQTTNRPKSSMVGSATSSAAKNSSTPAYLTKAHVQAAKEAGLWNDPKQREAFIARVKKESKANR